LYGGKTGRIFHIIRQRKVEVQGRGEDLGVTLAGWGRKRKWKGRVTEAGKNTD